jgi:flagellar motor component MotA
MDGAHAHLLFNHFPIIGSVLSVLVLLAGFILKNGIVKKTALAMIVFTSLMTIPAFLTGEPAEEVLEAINQAPDAIIHEHEEMGEKGLWTTLAVGALSIICLH